MSLAPTGGTAGSGFEQIAVPAVDAGSALVHVQGWQSWSPSGTYPVADPPRGHPGSELLPLAHGPGAPAPSGIFQGEGLLAVRATQTGPVHVLSVPPGAPVVPSVRAVLVRDSLRVSANGPVDRSTYQLSSPRHRAGAVGDGLRGSGGYARGAARSHRLVVAVRRLPRVADRAWTGMPGLLPAAVPAAAPAATEPDIVENLDAIEDLGLPVDVVLLDGPYPAGTGDANGGARAGSPGAPSPAGLAAGIRRRGGVPESHLRRSWSASVRRWAARTRTGSFAA